MNALLLLAVSLLPLRPGLVEARVDLVQHDSMHNERGEPTFDQVIFWADDGDGLKVVAWRLVHDGRFTPMRTAYGWQQTFFDSGTLRRVRARSWLRTWSQEFDPELKNREAWPEERRRGLGRDTTP